MKTDNYNFEFANYEDSFDDHIAKSIRGYDFLFEDCVSISSYFIRENSSILDIGCSTGKLIKEIKIKNENKLKTSYFGIDKSIIFSKEKPFEDGVNFETSDFLENSYEENQYSYITSLFTLQFIPYKEKLKYLKKVYSLLSLGGGFFISEKVYSDNSKIQNMVESTYLDFKKKSFSNDEIAKKEVRLRDHFSLNTQSELLVLLKFAGFNKIELIWRNFNFVGYICIK